MSSGNRVPPVTLRVTDHDGSIQLVELVDALVIGREHADVVLKDPQVSRRHVRIARDGALVVVTDLESANGTTVNNRPERATFALGINDVVRIGNSLVAIVAIAAIAATNDEPKLSNGTTDTKGLTETTRTSNPNPAESDHLRANTDPPALTRISRDLIEVASVPGTNGAAAAESMLDLAVRARRSLAGFGSESWGQAVTIFLVDPFPDPSGDPHSLESSMVHGGTVVNAAANEIWMSVTPEDPPEDPHRPLALCFGHVFPSASEIAWLVEGYGLHLSGAPDPSLRVVEALGGPLSDLDQQDRTAVVGSFVAHLLRREGEPTFRKLLASPPGLLATTVSQLYGISLTALEQQWRNQRTDESPKGETRRFLRLAWTYLKPYRRMQAEVAVYLLGSLAFTMAFPFLTRHLFDRAIPAGKMSAVTGVLGWMAALFVVSTLANLRQGHLSRRMAASVVRDLQTQLFHRLQIVPESWIGKHPQGDVLSRMMNDVYSVQSGLSTAIEGGVFQFVTLVVASVVMMRLNLPLALLVLIGAPLVAIVYRRMGGGARERSLAVQEEISGVMQIVAENYRANSVVKLFRLAGFELQRFDRASNRLVQSQLRFGFFNGMFSVCVESIVTILRLTVIGAGAWLVFEDRLTIGGLIAFLGIMSEVLGPITGLTTLGQRIQAAMGPLVRVEEMLHAQTEPIGSELATVGPVRRSIRFEDVSFSYSADRRSLDSVSFEVPVGQRVAFVGPSGSGKSTVLRLLMRLYEPDTGRILFDGQPLAEGSLESLRRQMGVVFQDSFLFDATIRENIAMGKVGASESDVAAAAVAAEVDSFLADLPRDLDTMVGEGGRNLSGGQRQRVAIARALIDEPRLLLLDEATSALDPTTERQINDTLRRVGASRTTIFITHRLTSVVDADCIHVIDHGRLVESGTHAELVALGETYARMWFEQTGGGPEGSKGGDADHSLTPAPAVHQPVSGVRLTSIRRTSFDAENTIGQVREQYQVVSGTTGTVVRNGTDASLSVAGIRKAVEAVNNQGVEQ